MATAEEKFRGVTGNSTNRRIQYVVKDATDDVEAISITESTCPAEYDNIPLTDIEVEELAYHLGLFLTTAVYTSDKPEKKETDTTEISFDVSLTTQHITQSLSTVAAYVPSGKTAVDYHGLIALDENGNNPEGVDVRVPIGAFQVTWYAPIAAVTSGYRKTLMETVGKVNNSAFYGHAAGEVLFVGASGQLRSGEDWQITYRFEVNGNRSGIVIGEGASQITVSAVNGWDVLWVKFKKSEVAGLVALTPEQANVERVYERADFATVLGI